MDAVAGARWTPGRHETGGVPPKPPATILLSLWPVRSTRGVAASYLTRCRGSRIFRPRRCANCGLVSRHKPAEHRIPDVSATPDVEASCITSCRGAPQGISFSSKVTSARLVVRDAVVNVGCIGGSAVQIGTVLHCPARDLFVDKVVCCTLKSQMEPEDMKSPSQEQHLKCYGRCQLHRELRSSDGDRSPLHIASLQICSWTKWIADKGGFRRSPVRGWSGSGKIYAERPQMADPS